MSSSENDKGDYGIQQVADQIHQGLHRYLEAFYHIRDMGLIEERRLLMDAAETIAQQPYLETTPTYEIGPAFADLGLPQPVGETLRELATWEPGIGIFPRPFTHQTEALEAFFNEGNDLIVATGTGSGKTETFLWPILGQLLQEAADRPTAFKRPGCRALLLYPMNALVTDQLSRLRRLFGDERLHDLFNDRYGRSPYFGMYTSRTPYPGLRSSQKDSRHLDSVLQYYLNLQNPPPTWSAEQRASAVQLVQELRQRGRWPAKDLSGFYGTKGGIWKNRLQTQPGDRELLTRHEIQAHCPDILVTNYSMLEYMLMRPVERPIFQQTREWLAADPRNSFILVVDEAHMYRGAAGAEVALLIRRLQARLGISRDRMRCILTSASLGSGTAAEHAVKTFATALTGHPIGQPMPFRLIRGTAERRPPTMPGSVICANHLASFDLAAFAQRADKPDTAYQAIRHLADSLGWVVPPTPANTSAETTDTALRNYLYDHLQGFDPLELLITTSAGHATAFTNLAQTIFPDADPSTAKQATSTLLALGTYARKGERALLPTRLHLFFRGLPALYACINPRCEARRHQPDSALLLGRLYTEPRTHCSCAAQARVFELYTHRRCGAAFLRVFGRGAHADFYWHEQGGDIEHIGQPLDETFLLVEPPHQKPTNLDKLDSIWLDVTTGRVALTVPADPANFRQVWRPRITTKGGASPKTRRQSVPPVSLPDAAEDEDLALGFSKCPICLTKAGPKIMDLATKGEQPFAQLVREQFMRQPATRPWDAQYPNGGRKVLLFSDGRQKAARLARDLPREVERDSFREAVVLAVARLVKISKEPRLDQTLYAAFLSVCYKYHLHFFDREHNSQQHLLTDITRFHDLADADLQTVFEEAIEFKPPVQYQVALLRQLADPYYTLYSVAVAVTAPRDSALRQIRKGLADFPTPFITDHLDTVVTAWVQALLEDGAFDSQINLDLRYSVLQFFKPLKPKDLRPAKVLDQILQTYGGLTGGQTQQLWELCYKVLTQPDTDAHPYLEPSQLKLGLALNDPWLQCSACGSLHQYAVLDHCPTCGDAPLLPLAADHPYLVATREYFRAPLRAVLNGAHPIHLTAEEHTAQIGQRDAGDVYATTEEYELRFQDVPLGVDKPPIDILSCTTTMEVGIDIGSLTAVGLRNVPPQRENYQQRAGRSGRRGSAVSTVLTYAQGGPHDNYYYNHPAEIISGEPRLPLIKVDNRRLARRHIHSFLIQTFFHAQLDLLSATEVAHLTAENNNLLHALGFAADFFSGQGLFSFATFCTWVTTNLTSPTTALVENIAAWLPDALCSAEATTEKQLLAEKSGFAIHVAQHLLLQLESLVDRYTKPSTSSVITAESTVAATQQEEMDNGIAHPPLLLNALFDQGLLPSYAFPTDLCTFYVFEYDAERRRVKITERPQQGKVQALSEYAPGRLLVINKETYRVGGIHDEYADPAHPVTALFVQNLQAYVYCPQCTYVRNEPLRSTDEPCPVCSTGLVQYTMLDPPGFSPERGRPVRERDTEQEVSYATTAQFPTPTQPDQFQWHLSAGQYLRYAYAQNRQLVVVNKGPADQGFRVCEGCGATWTEGNQPSSNTHDRPYQINNYILQQAGLQYKCSGPLHNHPLYLGHSYVTDLLLLRIALYPPLVFNPQDAWLHDALRTVAEALALAASRHLDIDPGELSAGYRLVPTTGADDPAALGIMDIYLFDTASGGAGYAAEAGEQLPVVLEKTLALLQECPAACERSCTQCLRHYGNRFIQNRLDRRLGSQLLTYGVKSTVPIVTTPADQTQSLQPLHRYLSLEGWTDSSNPTIQGMRVPLVMTPPNTNADNAQHVVIGTYPSLLDRTAQGFQHPLDTIATHQNLCVVLINDYILARDLPTAYRKLRTAAGLS